MHQNGFMDGPPQTKCPHKTKMHKPTISLDLRVHMPPATIKSLAITGTLGNPYLSQVPLPRIPNSCDLCSRWFPNDTFPTNISVNTEPLSSIKSRILTSDLLLGRSFLYDQRELALNFACRNSCKGIKLSMFLPTLSKLIVLTLHM